ncbi:hypothetical protein WG906_01505 [Pedobacter sp. P351]|uniref:hypothetical protein n=1 Tax=Pedobacter superstes TaxID=3133441 RepID=UPI00309F2A49
MKKGNLKTAAKARKAIRASIEENLSEGLKGLVVSLGYDPGKAKLHIAKASRKIAKQLAEKVKINELKTTAENALSTAQGDVRWDGEASSADVTPKVFDSSLLQSQRKGKKAVKANSKDIKSDHVDLAEQDAREKAASEEQDSEIQIGTS